MIAYNKDWLNNLAIQEAAEKAFANRCISKEELDAVKQRYPAGFYMPNLFIRIGLFLLTVVIVSAVFGLLALAFTMDNSERALGVLLFIFAIAAYFLLEVMVGFHNHYRSGVDDALIWLSGSFLIWGVNLLTDISSSGNALLIFIVAACLSLRFARAATAVLALLSLLTFVLFSLPRLGVAAKASLPFVLILISALLYLLAKNVEKQEEAIYYRWPLAAARVTLLICFYCAGNYYVVREGGNSLLHLDLPPEAGIAFGWFFWSSTFIVPVAYIVRGVQKKDAMFLRVGLLLVAALVFTVRYYYHILSPEAAMTIGGCLLLAIAYGMIRYLREPKHGFTSRETSDPHVMDKLNIEALIITQTFGHASSSPPADTGTQFGGGTGSGGGASGEY